MNFHSESKLKVECRDRFLDVDFRRLSIVIYELEYIIEGVSLGVLHFVKAVNDRSIRDYHNQTDESLKTRQ